MENNFLTLYHQFKEIVRTGTEEQARQFLLDHINEFPKEVKDGLVLAFFEDAVHDAAAQDSAVLEFKQQGIEAMTTLERAIRILDDKIKLIDLQEKL